MLTATLRRAGLDWKPDSLGYLIFGLDMEQGPDRLTCPIDEALCFQCGCSDLPGGGRLAVQLPRQSSTVLLGVKLTCDARDFDAQENRRRLPGQLHSITVARATL